MRLPSSVPRFSIRLPRSLCRKAIKSPSSPCLPVTWSDSAEWSPLTASNCTAWLWRALSKFLCKSAMRCPSPASSLSTVAQRWSQACVPSFISSSLALVAVRAEVVRSTAAVRPFIAVSRLSSTSRCCSCDSLQASICSAAPLCAAKSCFTSSACLSAEARNRPSRRSRRCFVSVRSSPRANFLDTISCTQLCSRCMSASSLAHRFCSLSVCWARSTASCLRRSLTIAKLCRISSFNVLLSCSASSETPATKSVNRPCKWVVNSWTLADFRSLPFLWVGGSLLAPRQGGPDSHSLEDGARGGRDRFVRTCTSSSSLPCPAARERGVAAATVSRARGTNGLWGPSDSSDADCLHELPTSRCDAQAE
mmetsp:Transcript_70629/g.195184  ORF Transcript_70629/g.195184 Transcript_70629/m.195184 type:complete len:365 (-) Transcript_70629:152-1246(-)